MTYIPGDFWRIDDVSGFKIRASDSVKQWNGLIVHRDHAEERHPQDFVRGRRDRQNVPDPSPEAVNRIVGPLTTTTTAASLPGSATLTVTSSVRFLGGDHIGVNLSDGSMHAGIVLDVPDASTITLTVGLSGSVPIGSQVTNFSAVSTPDLG